MSSGVCGVPYECGVDADVLEETTTSRDLQLQGTQLQTITSTEGDRNGRLAQGVYTLRASAGEARGGKGR